MNPWLLLFAIQVIGTLFALLREPKADKRFEGEKLFYRG